MQTRELQAQLKTAQPAEGDAAGDSAKLHELTNYNGQLEDHVASLDLQLEQTQQELSQTQQEMTQSQQELNQTQQELLAVQAELRQQSELAAAQRAQHAELQAQQAASKPWEEECIAKALQVCRNLIIHTPAL